MLSDDVVLISLYVDERKGLPKDQQYETKLAGKKKKVKTVGDKWMVLQANTYGTNSQPYYVFLDQNEQQLIEILQQHTGNKILLLSPMGGQGFLIGRGNLQLSPTVLRLIGISSVLGVATPAKLTGLSNVRIDTGDSDLDQEFRERKFVKMLQGYRTTRVIRVSEA